MGRIKLNDRQASDAHKKAQGDVACHRESSEALSWECELVVGPMILSSELMQMSDMKCGIHMVERSIADRLPDYSYPESNNS